MPVDKDEGIIPANIVVRKKLKLGLQNYHISFCLTILADAKILLIYTYQWELRNNGKFKI